jgi:hypothetical protein
MNIKSLLLGSAAALVAVSGARAADAVEVVAEPEPMEYVRVCDTYGTGFYYIPGTETCLRVGGYVRYDIGAGDLWGINDVIDKKDGTGTNDTWSKRARASLILDARNETELGTLRGFIQLNADWDTTRVGVGDVDGDGIDDFATSTNAPGTFKIAHAYIELGGFRIGKTDSLFSTFTGYAGGVVHDGIVPYGPFDTHQIAYTFDAGNGFTAAVALEEGSGLAYTIDSYVPHVVAGVGYTAGWGSVKVVGGYDSVWEEFAVKARLDVKASEAVSLFVMGGFKSDEAASFYGPWGGDWAIWGGASVKLSEKAVANVEIDYDDADNFSAVANVAYELVPGLKITPEVGYYDNLDSDDDGAFGGFVRFQRNF